MSEILVNKLTGVSTAGSIVVTGEGNSTTTNLQQGLAKVWSNFKGTSTVATRDSFNQASLTDVGTGDYTINFTSNMNNDDYSVNINAGDTSKTLPRVCGCGASGDSGFATSSHGITLVRTDTSAVDDMETVNTSLNGDLA